MLKTGRPLAVPDARTSAEIVPGRAEQHGIASTLFVPLSYDDDVRNVIILGWAEQREITPEDIGTAELAADRPPPASPGSRPRSAAPRARSRTARSCAPPAR